VEDAPLLAHAIFLFFLCFFLGQNSGMQTRHLLARGDDLAAAAGAGGPVRALRGPETRFLLHVCVFSKVSSNNTLLQLSPEGQFARCEAL